MFLSIGLERSRINSRTNWKSCYISNFMLLKIVIEISVYLGAVKVVGSDGKGGRYEDILFRVGVLRLISTERDCKPGDVG